MKLYGRILAYFYAVVLSIGGLSFSQYGCFIPENESAKQEVSYEEIGSLDQADKLYLISQSNNLIAGSFPGYSHPEIDHFFDGSAFPDLYWKISEATVLSFLRAVIVHFQSTDIIFPFHFFW